MRRILAVSGGIDSMVMLHLFKDDKETIVAHFDHGIRLSSSDDCEFVRQKAKEYGLTFCSRRANLGVDCSEEKARAARYEFLNELSQKYDAEINTAHHADDVVESMLINMFRGTGWRGIVPLRAKNIQRPLLEMTKSDIYRYATEHQVTFRVDQTNNEDTYLRNRIRRAISQNPNGRTLKAQLLKIYEAQTQISAEIEEIVNEILPQNKYYSRDIFTNIDNDCAEELLREILNRNQLSQTRPQMQRAIEAIRNYDSGKRFSLNKDTFLKISKYNFCFEKTK